MFDRIGHIIRIKPFKMMLHLKGPLSWIKARHIKGFFLDMLEFAFLWTLIKCPIKLHTDSKIPECWSVYAIF